MVRRRRSRPATSHGSGGRGSLRTSTPSCSSTSRRPAAVSLDEGHTQAIDGPRTRSSERAIPGANRDAILLVGVEPNYRWRTFSELMRARQRPRRRARRDPRRPPCRRPTHATLTCDRGGDRSAARRRARASTLALRGADRDRRRPARCVSSGGDSVRQPLGGRAALRSARAEPSSGSRAVRAARGGLSDRRSTSVSSPRPRSRTSSRSRRPLRATPTRRLTSRSSSSAPTRWTGSRSRAASPPAMLLQRRSRASCGSARRTAAASRRGPG